MTGGHSLGGARGHIKAHGLSPFPHQRKLCTEGLLALGMLGRTLIYYQALNCIYFSYTSLQVLSLCGVSQPANWQEEEQELSYGGGEGHAAEHRGRIAQDGPEDEASNGKDGLSRSSPGLPHQAGRVRERDDLSVLQVRKREKEGEGGEREMVSQSCRKGGKERGRGRAFCVYVHVHDIMQMYALVKVVWSFG